MVLLSVAPIQNLICNLIEKKLETAESFLLA
jgi:hypothetical protein